MRNLILFYLIFLTTAEAQLTCSARGTVVIFLNGIKTSDKESLQSTDEIGRFFLKRYSLLDKKAEVLFDRVHNTSRGLHNDILELLNQANRNLNREESKDFYKKLLETRMNILEQKSNWTTEENNKYIEEFKNQLDIIENLDGNPSSEVKEKTLQKIAEFDYSLAKLFETAVADLRIVEFVKKRFNDAVENKKKIIFIAHSQGNEVLRSAVFDYKREIANTDKLKEFNKTFGSLHVASPSPTQATEGKSKSFKLNRDMVIIGSKLIMPENPEFPTHKFEYSTNSGAISKIPFIGDLIEELFNIFGGNQYHGMQKIYLSNDVFASSLEQPSGTLAMRKIFEDRLIEVAETLEENCSDPIIDIDSELISKAEGSNLEYKINSYAGISNSIPLKIKDSNDSGEYDPTKTEFSWSVKSDNSEALNPYNGTISEFDFRIPYNDITYILSITAKNEVGNESKKDFKLKAQFNRPPTIQFLSKICRVNPDGTSEGYAEVKFRITDDSTMNGSILDKFFNWGEQLVEVYDTFGERGELRYFNDCPVIKEQFHYEVWSICQTGGCYQPPEYNDPNCNYNMTTGNQFNELRIFSKSGSYYTQPLSSGYHGGPTVDYFTDPNDVTKTVQYNPSSTCQRGQRLDEPFWFKTQ